MNFNDFDAHQKFGRFTATIEIYEDSSRGDVWLGDVGVSLHVVESGGGGWSSDEELAIIDDVYAKGLDKPILKWAYANGY